ncbi:hypothetical protein [Streptomyces sp. NPDC047976]|uniref:hypothetical protein n=1 Tax=Streptomyces sp. NPDC047976 TaxID=3155746 RepID=UPI00342C78A6
MTSPVANVTTNSITPTPRWAVWAAHLTTLVVLPSGLWRIAMVLGWQAGYTDEGFIPFDTPVAKIQMLTLSVVCELLAFLTIGLVRPWGEVVPRWIPLIGGARRPPHGRRRPSSPWRHRTYPALGRRSLVVDVPAR